MTEKDTIKFEEHTIVSYIWSNMTILFKDLIPPIQDKILKNQKAVTDLEKRIEKFMRYIAYIKDSGGGESEEYKEFLYQAEKCFGDIDLKK